MIATVNFLGRHAAVMMVFGIFIGLAVQPLASVSKPMLMQAVWALLMLSMMRLEPSVLFTAYECFESSFVAPSWFVRAYVNDGCWNNDGP